MYTRTFLVPLIGDNMVPNSGYLGPNRGLGIYIYVYIYIYRGYVGFMKRMKV